VRFDGEIAGLGTSNGPRIVVGRWFRSPLGAFVDVMLQQADGHRVLLAPTPAVAGFVASTYVFDEVVTGPVEVSVQGAWRRLHGPDLRLDYWIGRRTPLGYLLACQPRPMVRSPRWLRIIDPLARRVLPGVRTRGSAGAGRQEFYGAYDLRRVLAVEGTWRGRPLGGLAPLEPPVTFGFGSTPRSPVVTRLVTTILEQ
jgi:hypothetical protein